MNRKVALLTGATGFIGSALAAELVRRGFHVRALTSRSAAVATLNPSIEWCALNHDGIAESCANVDVFFHFAVAYDRPTIADAEIERVNVQLPLQILTALARNSEPATCVFGDSFFRKFPREATAQPRYTDAKVRLAAALRRLETPCRCAMLMIEQVYGPGDSMEKVFPKVTRTLLEDTIGRLALTDGIQRRDFIHRDDVVTAAITTSLADWSGCIDVPCGSGTATAVRDVFLKLGELSGSSVVLGFGDIPGSQGIDVSAADTSWLAARGWHAAVSLDKGLAELVDDVRHHVARHGATA